MKIFLGADHRGFELKEKIKQWLKEEGREYEDMGNRKYEAGDDFPDFALKVGEKVAAGRGIGILFCGSGGMALAANKIKGVRAVEAWDQARAKHAREHDAANVLAIPADAVDEARTREIVRVWLDSKPRTAAKYKRRLEKIKKLEGILC